MAITLADIYCSYVVWEQVSQGALWDPGGTYVIDWARAQRPFFGLKLVAWALIWVRNFLVDFF